MSYNLDVMVTKHTAYNEKFVHLQIGLCKCHYVGVLGQIRLWTYPMVTSYIPHFGSGCKLLGQTLFTTWADPFCHWLLDYVFYRPDITVKTLQMLFSLYYYML